MFCFHFYPNMSLNIVFLSREVIYHHKKQRNTIKTPILLEYYLGDCSLRNIFVTAVWETFSSYLIPRDIFVLQAVLSVGATSSVWHSPYIPFQSFDWLLGTRGNDLLFSVPFKKLSGFFLEHLKMQKEHAHWVKSSFFLRIFVIAGLCLSYLVLLYYFCWKSLGWLGSNKSLIISWSWFISTSSPKLML